MYLVVGKSDTHYSIIDTKDMVEEQLSKDDVYQLLQQGVVIWGTSSFSIENNTNLTVILRLHGEDMNDIRDYDGWLFTDYDSSRSPYYYQIMDVYNTHGELYDPSVFAFVCRNMRDMNRCPYNMNNLLYVSTNSYKVYAYNSKYLTLKDSNLDLYQCDFYTCLYCYLVEETGIEGVTSIDVDSLWYNGKQLKGVDVLQEYWKYSIAKMSTMTEKEKRERSELLNREDGILTIEGIECNYDELARTFGDRSMMVLSDSHIPLFDIRRVIRHSNEGYLYKPWFTEFKRITDVSQKGITFEDGRVLDDWQLIISLCRVLECINTDIKERFDKACNGRMAMLKISNEGLYNDYNKYKHYSRFLSLDEFWVIKPPSMYLNNIRDNWEMNIRADKFGCVEIKPTGVISDIDMQWKRVMISCYTNTTTAWWNFEDNTVCMGTQKEFHTGSRGLNNERFRTVYHQAVRDGLTYFDDSILPICVSEFQMDDDGINIKICCLVVDTVEISKEPTLISVGVIQVPLIFFGGKIVDFGDYIKVYTLAHSIALDKQALSNLSGVGNYDCLFYNQFADLNSLKPNRELIKYMDKDIAKCFKDIIG